MKRALFDALQAARAAKRPAVVATALGALPGTLAFTLFGASIERFDGGIPSLNSWVLVASVALFLVSLGLSRLIKRRGGNTVGEEAT